jgi:hypothetical protein
MQNGKRKLETVKEILKDFAILNLPSYAESHGSLDRGWMRGGYPSKLQRSVVGCASEGSARRSLWRSHGF